jgi:WD40 repeat protein
VAGIDPVANEESTGAAALWDIVDRCEVATFPGGARAIAFTPDGNHVAVATLDQTVCIWDVQSRKMVTELGPHHDAIHAIAFSPDGKLLASAGDDFIIRFWDTADWSEKSLRELDCQVQQMIFAPDGKSIYLVGGNGVCCRLTVNG